VQKLFADGATLWREWEANITKLSRPDAALRIADAIQAELGKTGGERPGK
jgi:hypothetical protein